MRPTVEHHTALVRSRQPSLTRLGRARNDDRFSSNTVSGIQRPSDDQGRDRGWVSGKRGCGRHIALGLQQTNDTIRGHIQATGRMQSAIGVRIVPDTYIQLCPLGQAMLLRRATASSGFGRRPGPVGEDVPIGVGLKAARPHTFGRAMPADK